MRRAVAIAGMTTLLAGTAPAQPQFESGPVPEERDVREALAGEIARMKADIAAVERFMSWQVDLARIARTDRAEALRQRLPMADCRASVLAPLCDELTGLFRPEDFDGGSVAGRVDPDTRDFERKDAP